MAGLAPSAEPRGHLSPLTGPRLVYACALLVGALPLIAGHIGATEPDRLRWLVAGYAAAGLPFLGVVWGWRSLDADRRTLLQIVGLALGLRLALLSLPPLLSEDIWRYVWDGAMQLAGLNPYQHAPASTALDAVATGPLVELRGRIGHPEVPTIYPPAAQVGFALGGLFGPSERWLRALWVLCEGVTIAGLWVWLRALGRRPQAVALYAFAPLTMLETAVGGHVEALGVCALVLAGALLATGRGARAGAALGVAVLTKLLPIAALPALLFARRWRALSAFVVTGLALTLPYLLSGPRFMSGLRAFSHRWRANEGGFALLAAPFEWLWPSKPEALELPEWGWRLVRRVVGTPPGAEVDAVWPDEASFAAAKLLAAAIVGLFWLWLCWRRRDFEGLLGPTVACVLLVSPVVHPWYLLWLFPFLVLAIGEGRTWPWPFLLWSGFVWLAYLPRPAYLEWGLWLEPEWLPWMEYSGLCLGLVIVGLRAVQHRR